MGEEALPLVVSRTLSHMIRSIFSEGRTANELCAILDGPLGPDHSIWLALRIQHHLGNILLE